MTSNINSLQIFQRTGQILAFGIFEIRSIITGYRVETESLKKVYITSTELMVAQDI